MTSVEILKGMLELFDEDSKWTRGSYARDEEDAHVHYTDETACSWCLLGGLYKVGGVDSTETKQAYDWLREKTNFQLQEFNDYYETQYEDIIVLLEDIIAEKEV